jgi:hypothetical protein
VSLEVVDVQVIQVARVIRVYRDIQELKVDIQEYKEPQGLMELRD